MKTLYLAILVFSFSSLAQAASFDCGKASTFIEKAICSENKLSALDESLASAFKNILTNASKSDENTLRSQQKAWLVNVRNKCADSACLVQAYTQRLAELGGSASPNTPSNPSSANDVVLGRCHMNGCWWWKVAKVETVKDAPNGKLLKVSTRSTSEEYSEAKVEKQGYPDLPSKNSKWDGISESFIFCSSKLPSYIAYDPDKKHFVGTIPFDQNGESSGATEGIANLYAYVCKTGKAVKFKIDPEFDLSEKILDKPTDIFDFTH